MQSELGGLFYEMAIRDHVQMEVLIERAAELQRVDAELGQVEHLLREDGRNESAGGRCPNCAAPHARGAAFCSQCSARLDVVQRLSRHASRDPPRAGCRSPLLAALSALVTVVIITGGGDRSSAQNSPPLAALHASIRSRVVQTAYPGPQGAAAVGERCPRPCPPARSGSGWRGRRLGGRRRRRIPASRTSASELRQQLAPSGGEGTSGGGGQTHELGRIERRLEQRRLR